MPTTINRVELLGRVGTDPARYTTASGTALTRVRLATDRRGRNGPAATDWHTVICWGKLAEAVTKRVRVGQRLYVCGKLVTGRSEGPDGQPRTHIEVHAAEVVFLDARYRAIGDEPSGPEPMPAESDATAGPF